MKENRIKLEVTQPYQPSNVVGARKALQKLSQVRQHLRKCGPCIRDKRPGDAIIPDAAPHLHNLPSQMRQVAGSPYSQMRASLLQNRPRTCAPDNRRCDMSSTVTINHIQKSPKPIRNSCEPLGTPSNYPKKFIYLTGTCLKAQSTKNNIKQGFKHQSKNFKGYSVQISNFRQEAQN